MFNPNRFLTIVRAGVLAAGLLAATACRDRIQTGCRGDYCGTIVFASTGQPVSLLPPVTDEIIDRDIHDQIFLKLADIGAAQNTIGDVGFEKQLADGWTWRDSLTLAFHIDRRAKWHDGQSVTAQDVAFTFAAFTDKATDSPYRSSLERIASVTAQDSGTAVFKFRARYPEMFFDAVYYLRILPSHLLASVPLKDWRSAAFGRAPVGNGPYRFVKWTAGQSLELAADSTFFLGRPHIRRLIWRFTSDLPVAVTQVAAGEADAIEVLVSPSNIERATAAPQLALYPYAGAAYTILGFNLRARGDASKPHPILGDATLRRALVLATDRQSMMTSVFGTAAKLPAAPIPQAWTALWFKDRTPPGYDTVQAKLMLDAVGWKIGGDGIRHRGIQTLSFAIAVPSTSAARKQYARLIQEQLRGVGVAVTIDEMDMATLQGGLRAGTFDSAIQTYVNDPTPNSGIPQAWAKGGGTNFGRYHNAEFEAQVKRAVAAQTPDDAAPAWHLAFDLLAQDAPAIVLNAPDNVAAVAKRVTDVRLRPDSYWAYVRTWRIPPDQLTDRDRVER